MTMPRIFSIALLLTIVAVAAVGCGGVTGIPEADFQALQSQYDAAKQSLATVQSQLDGLNQDLKDAQAARDELEAQLADATSGGIDPAEYQALQQQYDDSAARVTDLTGQLSDLNSQLSDLTGALNTAKAQNASYIDQIADLQQQVDELSATPTTVPPLPLTADNVKNMVWDRIAEERAAATVPQLQTGTHLVQWSADHVQQMATVLHTTTYTDAVVGVQAANMAVGYLSVSELVDATFLFWKISPAWFTSIFLQPSVTFGAVSVLQVGSVFYISFMASNVP